MKKWLFGLLFLSMNVGAADSWLKKIVLPPGFKISVFADGVRGARSMAWGSENILFVGTRDEGKVYAIEPSGKVHVLLENLNEPNGVAFRNGSLFVAEVHRLLEIPNVEKNLDRAAKPKVLARFPTDQHHGWKFIAFGPDGRLYVPEGAPCNVCELKDPYGSLSVMDRKEKTAKIIARGIRNTVGFDWHPVTHELWFTDNGRDMLGDDIPPDELNRITREGLNFGFPHCHAGDILDPEFGKGQKCDHYQAPEKKLGAHVAALGMRFYTGSKFPSRYQKQIFIAEHGSWNRTVPQGYRITWVRLGDDGHAKQYEVFAEGWLRDGTVRGRPVDLINTPDGALLVSDDFAGMIYKIDYEGQKSPQKK